MLQNSLLSINRLCILELGSIDGNYVSCLAKSSSCGQLKGTHCYTHAAIVEQVRKEGGAFICDSG